MTDLCIGWTECRATWNKGAQGVMTQIKAIQQALPFPLKGFDCDNGSRIPQLAFAAAFPEPIAARQVHALASLSLERQCLCRAK